MPVLARRQHRFARVEADDVLDLSLDRSGSARRQVDLVEHRNDLEIVFEREIRVGERLRLDTLRGIDDEQRTFARGAASARPRR